MRKGQLEIFGLAIIVILLALGLLFALIVLTKEEPRSMAKESLLAENFLTTMMSTTVNECNNKEIRALLQDCALSDDEWRGASKCTALNTCETAQYAISSMLVRTLGTWGKTYTFKITGAPAVERIVLTNGNCTGEREQKTKPELIRPGYYMNVVLTIC